MLMSGSSCTVAIKSGVPLSSLSVYPQPDPTDLVFGIFNGQGQFVPQSQIWSGAVATTGGRLSGALLSDLVPAQPDELVNKAYVDRVTKQVNADVSDLVSQAQAAADKATEAADAAVEKQKGAAGGLAALSGAGNLLLGGVECFGVAHGNLLLLTDLPGEDPGVQNALWNNGGYLCISRGA